MTTPAPIRHWQIERHELVDSTNRLAVERIHTCWQDNRSAAGMVIVASRQANGQGQHGRAWASPPGGLYLSAIVENVPIAHRDRLALVAGVAVAEALIGAYQVSTQLRWPNDLVINDRKVGGILCEAMSQGDRWAAIIGIGVNVNTRIEDLPPELQSRAATLCGHHNGPVDILAVETSMLRSLANTLEQFSMRMLSAVIERARRLDALLNRRVQFQDGDRRVDGTARGISDSGELLIQMENGIEAFAVGTIAAIDGLSLRP